MDMQNVNVYEACDRAIKSLDRLNVEMFGQLKLAKWDQISVIRTVVTVYQKTARQARKRYLEVAFEAYLLMMAMCDVQPKKAHRMAEKTITQEWIDKVLSETDFVTLYRFDTETERKAYRLAETLEVTENRNAEIDKALRYWSQQIGQYAINVTDYAMVQAMQDAGVEEVEWITQKDERVCHFCHSLEGKVFKIDEIPPKHMRCRCHVKPVLNGQTV